MIRKFITFAVEKAILNHILFLLMFIMAIFAYKSIPKELFPPAELDIITIRGAYSGASGEVLDQMAVIPLEEDLKNVAGIDRIDSVIKNGSFLITLELKEHTNPQQVLNDVKDIITNHRQDWPSDMNEPVAKVLVHQFPLLLIAVSGDVPKEKLLKAAKELKNRLSQIKDLGTIAIRGDASYEVTIQLNEAKIEALGLPQNTLYQAISQISSIYPAGSFKSKDGKIYLSSINGQKEIKKLQNLTLNVGGKFIRLNDIASISYGLGKAKEISDFNGKENISLNVTKQKSGNAIELSKKIKKILQNFQKHYPKITFKVYTDTSVWIRNRINLVTSNIFFGLILVFLAIFLSVNWQISFVVALGIPTSFFIGLITAKYLGYSMNMLTMLGALLALGMLVDEAIVVAENIFRHIEMGKTPKEAAIEGSIEMFPAVLTATSTTIFAFLPLLLMSGKIGIFIKVLPVMISILLLSSLFEAFYFLPLHAKELFTFKNPSSSIKKESPFWQKLQKKYQNSLLILLKEKVLVVALMVTFILGATAYLLKQSTFELMPKFDAQQIYLSGKTSINNTLEETKKEIIPLEQALLKELNSSDVSSITSIVGIKFNPDNTFESGEHLFHIFINLNERKPQNFFDKYINPIFSLEYDNSNMKRQKSAFEILEQAKKILNRFKNTKNEKGEKIFKDLTIFVPQAGIVKHDIELSIVDDGTKNVDLAIATIIKKLHEIGNLIGISTNKKLGPKEIKLQINSYGQKLGFSEAYLIQALQGLFLETYYSKMLNKEGVINVILKEKNKDKAIDLKNIQIATPDGSKFVALKEITNFITIKRPLTLYKENGKRIWNITAQTIKGKSVASKVMQKLKPTIEKLRKQGYKIIIKGEAKENAKVIREMSEAAILAIFLIFIALVLMFDSLILSLITLSVIPLSILGALFGTKIMGLNLTMPGLMGIVGLAGVVVNDAIIMLDFIKTSINYNDLAKKASTRIRPIMLTSITTLLGLSTLIFFASGQALVIQPMAVSLGFGLAWATILNLIFVPLLFALIYKIKAKNETTL